MHNKRENAQLMLSFQKNLFTQRTTLLTTLLAVSVLCGCSDGNSDASSESVPPVPYAESNEKTQSGGNAAGSSENATSSHEREFRGISFTIPDDWKELELSPRLQGFIEAKYEISTPDGTAQLTLTSMGGGIQENVKRWIDQFQPPADGSAQPQVEKIDISGVEATYVDVRGTFQSGFGPNTQTKSNHRVLGVAIPLQSQADDDFFLKLVGPRDVVADIQEDFREFAQSAQIEKNE